MEGSLSVFLQTKKSTHEIRAMVTAQKTHCLTATFVVYFKTYSVHFVIQFWCLGGGVYILRIFSLKTTINSLFSVQTDIRPIKSRHLPLFSSMKEEIMRSHSSFLVSSKTKTRSNLLRRGLPSAMFTETDSSGSYWPFGLVAASIVVLVFSLHTKLKRDDQQLIPSDPKTKFCA